MFLDAIILLAQYEEDSGEMAPVLPIAIVVILVGLIIVGVMLRRETKAFRKPGDADTDADRPPQ